MPWDEIVIFDFWSEAAFFHLVQIGVSSKPFSVLLPLV
jgi:hypothetical protein